MKFLRAGGALVVVLAAIVPATPVIATTTPVIATTTPEAASLQAAFGLSPREAERRISMQEGVGRLQEEALLRWPASFAGLWIDHEAGGDVFIAFTDRAASRVAALRRTYTGPARLHAVTVARSLAELRLIQKRMIADREDVRAGRRHIPGIDGARYALDIDLRGNVVVAVAEDPGPAASTAMGERYGPAVVVQTGSVGGPKACPRADCRSSLRSGLEIARSGAICSSAFTSNNHLQMFTAGHCVGGPGETWSHGGTAFGTAGSFQEFGAVDAAVINRTAMYAGAWIYVSGGQPARPVTGVGTYAQMAVGQTVCKAGRTTNETCGQVTSTTYSPPWITAGFNFIKTNFCADFGDSGAGVYMSNTAVGIMSGGSVDPCDFNAFGHISFAQAALNSSVDTIEPAPAFTGIEGVASGSTTFTARFSKPVICSSVDTGDFRVRSTLLILEVATHNVVDRSCSNDSDSTIVLTINPAPISLTILEVSLVGSITDVGGNGAPGATHNAPVPL